MKVTVVIPTYNEEDVIGGCLESLSKQTCGAMEVVIVDDGSTDNTCAKVKVQSATLKFKSFKLLRQKHRGPGQARNLGARHARGEILVFVDSDMTFDKDFVKRLVAPIERGEAKGTFSKEEYVANSDNVWAQCWGVNEGWEEGKRHPADYPNTQKVFRAILKSEFDKVGGFTSTGYTDDWTLSDKLGYEAVNAPGAVFYHKNPATLREVFMQAKWIGKREYKLGVLGKVVAMVRAILLVSLVVGLVKSVLYIKPGFVVFKVVYDAGVFLGVLVSLTGGGSAK